MTIDPFTFDGLPARIVFRNGALADVASEVERLGMRRVLVLSNAARRDTALAVLERLGPRAVRSFTRAEGEGIAETAEGAVALARANGIGGVVAIGGGPVMGIAKALALRFGLRQLAVPTTFAGAEASSVFALVGRDVAAARTARRTMPDTILYDPSLAGFLAPDLAAASGMAAIAHAVEGLWAADANPATRPLAKDAIARLARALPRLAEAPDDGQAREEAFAGAWLAACNAGGVTMGLAHDLALVLSEADDLVHGAVAAALLPHVVAFNREAAPAALEAIADALGAQDAVGGLVALAERLGCRNDLYAVGVDHGQLDEAAAQVAAAAPPNPRPVDRDAIRTLLEAAYAGPPA